ncbi:unnamed protein product [Spirodela intermedia]|uniref:C2H2-type domain-containing protein n=1 Tax=Spirodela intermedia TaxID=51605 RepID=A0A7I8J5V7_SPIIN|nr:unnamed protein product [Spirodela intermedia]CAA6665439.1 unnamed protein product [Spirodela intermedia]
MYKFHFATFSERQADIGKRIRSLRTLRKRQEAGPQVEAAWPSAAAAEKMIKRRFYKVEHPDNDGSSSSSSSSEDAGEEEDEEKEVPADEWRKRFSLSDGSSASGYESEDSSGNEISCDSTGLPVNDNEDDSGKDKESRRSSQRAHEGRPGEPAGFASKNDAEVDDTEELIESEMSNCMLKHKSVFKCRICPRIVCLSESTLLAHLKSKRHARSKKLLGDGRLKLMLNSDGEIEEDQETHAERHARTIALVQNSEAPKRKKRGRQRQRERRKLKSSNGCDVGKGNPPPIKAAKKRRHKVED